MKHIHYALAVLNRFITVFAVVPAVAVVVFFALAFQFSFHEMTRGFYSYLEQVVRVQEAAPPAPPGFLTVRECQDKFQASTRSSSSPKAVCEKYEWRQVRIEDMAREASKTLSLLYWIVVLVGSVIHIGWMGPRRFFLMERMESQPMGTSNAASRK